MNRWRTALLPDVAVPAPTTGVYLGRNKSGPLTMRLFRPRGTRIAVFSGPLAAQLIALRAAQSGATVRVMSTREAAWGPVLRFGADARLLPPTGPSQMSASGPQLLVDDRPDISRPFAEVPGWQCMLDVRVLGSDAAKQVDENRVASFGNADVAFFSVLGQSMAAAVGNVFDLREAAASLTVVPPHAVAVVTRGSVQLVRLEPTGDERSALRG
ncbi:hypothetical protein [Nocardioides jensenii]|uniref:hypothetical protein n=1 Tax=Nocardioides jensenii TaxID=1843 RepID=UPI000830D4D8|nr:hypothetical protein [Nocardioides jensenii]